MKSKHLRMRLDLGVRGCSLEVEPAARSTHISLLDSVACGPWTVTPKPRYSIMPRYFHISKDGWMAVCPVRFPI